MFCGERARCSVQCGRQGAVLRPPSKESWRHDNIGEDETKTCIFAGFVAHRTGLRAPFFANARRSGEAGGVKPGKEEQPEIGGMK